VESGSAEGFPRNASLQVCSESYKRFSESMIDDENRK